MQSNTITIKEKAESILDDIRANGANTVGITDDMVEHIKDPKNRGALYKLVLTNSTITQLALKALLEGYPNVHEINFTGTKIPSSSLDDLIRFISTNSSLKRVTLEDCGFAPEELVRIASSVKPSLECLDVSNNSLLTSRGKVSPTESQIVSIFKILKDRDVVLRVSQSCVISLATQRYLTLCKQATGAECRVGVGMRYLSGAEELNCIARIRYVNNLVAKYSRLGAGYTSRPPALNPDDFQAFRIAGVLEFFEIALVVKAGMSKDQAKGICSSVKTQLSKISTEVNADIAFAYEVARKCEEGRDWRNISSQNIGLSLQGFNRLAKCEGLVRNALRMQHGFTDENVEGQIKELKRQAAELVKVAQQQKAEADKQRAEVAKYKSDNRQQKQSHTKSGVDTAKFQKSLQTGTSIPRNR